MTQERIDIRAAIDEEVIESLRELQGEDEPDLIGELFGLFFRDTPQRIADIQAAVREADAGRMGRGAHALKSASGNLGCFPLSDLCAKIEMLGRNGALTGADELVAGVVREYARVQSESRRFIGDVGQARVG